MNMRDQTGSGLIDDFVLDIKDARFFHDARFSDGEVALLELSGINSETASEDHIWLKAGKTWQAADDGARIEYIGTAKHPKVNKQSQYGVFIESFLRCEGADEVMAEKKMDAFVAESWVGLSLGVHRGSKTYTIDSAQQEGTIFEVTSIEGVVFTEDAANTPTVEIPKATEAKLKKLAKDSKDFETFIDRAYDEIGGMTGATWEDHVSDAGDSGFFALNSEG